MNSNPNKQGQRGAALLMALVISFVIAISAAAFHKHLLAGFTDYQRLERETQLLHLAEGGIDRGLALLRGGEALFSAFEIPLGPGVVHVAAVKAEAPHTYHITAVAKLRDGDIVRAEDTYTATVRRNADGTLERLNWLREKRQL